VLTLAVVDVLDVVSVLEVVGHATDQTLGSLGGGVDCHQLVWASGGVGERHF
jgi:hypothetical protein